MDLHHQFLELLLAVGLTGIAYAQLENTYHILTVCAVLLSVALVLLVARYFRKDPTDKDQCTEDQVMRFAPTAATMTALVVGVVVSGVTLYAKKADISATWTGWKDYTLDLDPVQSLKEWQLERAQKAQRRAAERAGALQEEVDQRGRTRLRDFPSRVHGAVSSRFGRRREPADVQLDDADLPPDNAGPPQVVQPALGGGEGEAQLGLPPDNAGPP